MPENMKSLNGYMFDAEKLNGKPGSEYASAESLRQLKDDIGDAWAARKTYAMGDYCISGNQLYKCKTAHTAGSAFNANYWDAVNMAAEVKNKFGSNHLATTSFVSESTYKISLYPFNYKDAAIIFGCGGDGQGILITYSNGYIGILHKPSNIEVTAPSADDGYMSFTIKNNHIASESGFLGVIALNNNVKISEV